MNKKVLEAIAGKLGFDVKVLTQAISAEENSDAEKNFKVPEGKLYSDNDIETIKDNYGKERYDAGKVVGEEQTLKTFGKKAGFETIERNPDKIFEAFKSQVIEESKLEPNAKIEELNSSLSKLQAQVEEKEEAYNNLVNQSKIEKERLAITSMFPDLSEVNGLSREEAAELFFLKRELKEDGVYTKDGQKLKDHLEKPLSREDAVKAFIDEKGWAEKIQGRGGGANGGNQNAGSSNTPTSLEEYEKFIESKGWSPGSEEARTLLTKATQENPDNF